MLGRGLSLDPMERIRVYGPYLSSPFLCWKKLAHLKWTGLQDSGVLLLQMCRFGPMTDFAQQPMGLVSETGGLVAIGPSRKREMEQEQDLELWIADLQFDQRDPRPCYEVSLEFPLLKFFSSSYILVFGHGIS